MYGKKKKDGVDKPEFDESENIGAETVGMSLCLLLIMTPALNTKFHIRHI